MKWYSEFSVHITFVTSAGKFTGSNLDQHQRNKSKERRDNGKVWSKTEFQDAIRVFTSNNGSDNKPTRIERRVSSGLLGVREYCS
jgi:hypothetical protein